MKEKVYLGIDPGQTGAIAILTADDRVVVHDYPGDERALVDLCRSIHLEHRVAVALVEAQQSRPGMSVKTMFDLGGNYHSWLTVCAAFDWPAQTIRPGDWKRGFNYPSKVTGEKPSQHRLKSKKHSLTLARRLYPSAADHLALERHHDRAEAVLLAHLARMSAGGMR
jgi:hypothetical protein